MIEIGSKEITKREAMAEGMIAMASSTLELIKKGKIEKGDVLATARVAAVLAAKSTATIIPLCHPIEMTGARIDFELNENRSFIRVTASVRAIARTGVEMEALLACAAACLTIYDMCKAVDRGMTIFNLRLLYKSGGRSGEWRRDDQGGDTHHK